MDTKGEQTQPVKRRTIGFLNWAHAVDHYVLLIFPTAVLSLEGVYGRPYAELIALSTPSFVAFGLFSLPAGWLADRWSRRNMMALFYAGCGLSLVGAAYAPNLPALAAALFLLGVFAAIYHPVGMAMLIEASQARGRTLAFNGVCGNLGAALAAGTTAALASWLGWRSAFLVPAGVCLATAPIFWWSIADDRHQLGKRQSSPAAPLSPRLALMMFGLFLVIALSAGLIFNAISVAVPKIVEERLGGQVGLAAVGGLATTVFFCGAAAQLAVGRLVEWIAPHVLLAVIVAIGLVGTVWATTASGLWLMLALALVMVAIYGQVTVTDMVLARFSADAWRGRLYAVRYFLLFISAGAAVEMIARFHEQGGFALVLLVTAAVTLLFLLAAIGVAILATLAQPGRTVARALPAE
ncbi:MAG TPA: MFS transporter [Xanthobacteraceae bacterium]|nr:MFS transporter [Xanthobacteraceae bacterium]